MKQNTATVPIEAETADALHNVESPNAPEVAGRPGVAAVQAQEKTEAPAPVAKSTLGAAEKELLEQWLVLGSVTAVAQQALIQKLPEISKLVCESASSLSEQFKELAEGAKGQADSVQQVVEMASHLSVGSQKITLDEFFDLFKNTLSNTVEKILYISKNAMTMVFSLDDAIEAIHDIERFTTRIQAINKQTNLLSLNATIESSRAGEAGKGFAVVANEVRSVSKEINALSDEMKVKIDKLSDNVRQGYQTLKEVATTDMSESMAAQDELELFMKSLISQNENFKKVLENAASDSQRTSDAITALTVLIQFQDRTSQYIENSVNVLDFLSGAVGEIMKRSSHISTEGSKEVQKHYIEGILKSFTLSEFARLFEKELAVKGLREGSKETGEQQAETAEDDDIELF
ncbi:MAG: hypothetical protein H6908_04125 [Hyphomicrobiales bacterium]|nr:hypothetical protein [Hyphomicrobiales bacterium]